MLEATGCDIEYGFRRRLTDSEMEGILDCNIDWDKVSESEND